MLTDNTGLTAYERRRIAADARLQRTRLDRELTDEDWAQWAEAVEPRTAQEQAEWDAERQARREDEIASVRRTIRYYLHYYRELTGKPYEPEKDI